MNITQIENLLATAVKAMGYSPLMASEQTLDKEIKEFPTAWIQLPKVLYVEGRNQGIICHKIVVTLFDDFSAYSFSDKADRLGVMQEDALEIMKSVSRCEGVVEIDSLTVTPRIVSTTRHGDIAQLCEASIISYF